MTRPYSVSERTQREVPDGPDWKPVPSYVVVDDSGRDIGDTTEDAAEARKWCGWMNDAHERAAAKLVEARR